MSFYSLFYFINLKFCKVVYPTILLGCLVLLVKRQLTFLLVLSDAAGVTACQR